MQLAFRQLFQLTSIPGLAVEGLAEGGERHSA